MVRKLSKQLSMEHKTKTLNTQEAGYVARKDTSALAWQTLNKLNSVWKSDLSDKMKVQFSRGTTETIVLYGCMTWSMTKADEKRLDGTYTRMLKVVRNVSWKDMITNRKLNGKLEKVTTTIIWR